MIAEGTQQNQWRSRALMLAVLVAGVLAGFALVSTIGTAPRERALLWDDYILATASLYQREGDIARARERLGQLPIDDPAQAVAALAAVYVPDAGLGEDSAAALRDLASALSGHPVAAMPAARPAAAELSAGQLLAAAAALAQNRAAWAGFCLLAACWTGLTALRDRRSARKSALPTTDRRERQTTDDVDEISWPTRRQERSVAGRPQVVPKNGTATAVPVTTQTVAVDTPAVLALTMTYEGDDLPFEEVQPIKSPTTGRAIAACGMTSGPSGPDGGYLGFLIWLHEQGNGRTPQTIGLVAEPVAGGEVGEIAEWMAYVRLTDLVVARPGTIGVLETPQLRAVVSVFDVARAKSKLKPAAFTRLSVRMEITLKRRARHAPHLAGATPRE